MSTAVPIIRGEGEGERLWFAGGGVMTMKATAEETDGAFVLLEDRMMQGKTTPLHSHPNLDETLIVLEGEILVYAEGTEHRVGPRGVAVAPRGVPHAFMVTSESALILALQTPGSGQAFYREASEPAAAETDPGRPPDWDRLRAAAERHPDIIQILGPPPFETAKEFAARAEAQGEPPDCRSLRWMRTTYSRTRRCPIEEVPIARTELVDHELQEMVKPLLQDRTPRRTRRPRVSDGAASTAIVFMLATEIPLRLVPQQIACPRVSAQATALGVAASGVWERLHRELLRRLNVAGRIDWSRGAQTQATSALFEGGLSGPSPVDRARTGSKHHPLVDAAGVPLASALMGGNRNDVTQPLLILDGSRPDHGKVGRLHQRSDRIVADRGYDQDTTTTTTHDGSYGSGQGGNTVTRSKG